MDLPVYIDPAINICRLPHQFLNYLLAEGHDFQESMCLKISGSFGHVYAGVLEFKGPDQGCSIDIGLVHNQFINLITGEYVHVETVSQPVLPLDTIVIQGHNDSFGDVKDVKEKLEILFSSIRVLNRCMSASIAIDTDTGTCTEFTVVKLLNREGEEMEWGITVDTEIRVDFVPTRETVEREEKEQERKELEKRGFYGEGKKVGTSKPETADMDMSLRERRLAWLDKLR